MRVDSKHCNVGFLARHPTRCLITQTAAGILDLNQLARSFFAGTGAARSRRETTPAEIRSLFAGGRRSTIIPGKSLAQPHRPDGVADILEARDQRDAGLRHADMHRLTAVLLRQ